MKTAKILVCDPYLELDCAHAVASALKPEFRVQMITLQNMRYSLYDCDLLVVGGGIGDSELFNAVTDKDGTYTIEGVPPGKYTVKTWHEKLKELSQEVTVEAGKATKVDFDLKRRR